MYQIYFPTDLYFGAGALKRTSQNQDAWKKALVVTTSGKSIKRFGYLAELEKQLKEQNVEFSLFDKNSAKTRLKTVLWKRLPKQKPKIVISL